MIKIPSNFEWHDKDYWFWPENDEKLMQVNDWVSDLWKALLFVDRNSVCVQAGGACGLWPAYLSNHFSKVITFEPVKQNMECLRQNIKGIENITAYPAALSSNKGVVGMSLDDSESNNCGAYYAGKKGTQIPCMSIDSLKLGACDFIQLDIEGFELMALKGATDTIEKFSPVIMIEEKPLPHMPSGSHLHPRQLLESIGYHEVAKTHRDVVFER